MDQRSHLNLSRQVDHFEGPPCVDLLEGLISSIGPDFDMNNIKCLELFPKLLGRASQMKAVKVSDCKKRRSECSGSEYLDYVLSELCKREWPKQLVVPLITVIRDLHLTEDRLFLFVKKIAREANRLELQELPPLVYQVYIDELQGNYAAIEHAGRRFFCSQVKGTGRSS